MNPVYLASYPRSGNTYLRTILNYCFGLRSGSVYPNDLGNNQNLERYVGHIEHENGTITFAENNIPLIKTHELKTDQEKTIYIMRDARPASLSLFKFNAEDMPLDQIILGQHPFGRWCDHLASWRPDSADNTLFIKYESLLLDLESHLQQISAFLDAEIISTTVPGRDVIADGKWVKKTTDWKDSMSDRHIELCTEVNKEMLEYYGYI